MTLPTNTNLSDAALIARANELAPACRFRKQANRHAVQFSGTVVELRAAFTALRAEAAQLREKGRTHEGYLAGAPLHAARFEMLAARVRLMADKLEGGAR